MANESVRIGLIQNMYDLALVSGCKKYIFSGGISLLNFTFLPASQELCGV